MTATSAVITRPSLRHVTMNISRLDEMIEWYGLALGTRVQFRNEVARPDDIADVVSFLASTEVRSMTGHALCADGWHEAVTCG